MKNILFLLLTISVFAFSGCSDDKEGLNTNIALNVGESYTFPSGVEVVLGTDKFFAEISNTSIKALRAGETKASVKMDGVAYDLSIKITANNTLYNNEEAMSYMMKDKTAIVNLLGEPITIIENNLYTFAPLPEYDGAKAISIQFYEDVAQAIQIIYPSTYISRITKHIEDRYYKNRALDGYIIFLDGLTAATWKTEIFVQNANNEASVLYMTRKFAEETIK